MKYETLLGLHNAFFENDKHNMITMGIGFAISVVTILVVVGLFQL